MTVDLFGEQTAQLMTAMSGAGVFLVSAMLVVLGSIVALRPAQRRYRGAIAQLPWSTVFPSRTAAPVGVVLITCLPTRAPPDNLHRPRPARLAIALA